jgi:predicted RNase H-like HicB family nuclease
MFKAPDGQAARAGGGGKLAVAAPAAEGQLFRIAQSSRIRVMSELVFEVIQEADGGFVAECLSEGIFTQADHWDELRQNVREAVAAYFFDRPERPSTIRLHLVRDEVLACG